MTATTSRTRGEEREELPLSKAAEYLLEECRMVLPGIQALFGFQLIAVFNTGFDTKLTHFEQELHLLAIGFMALAIALIMTPAAYHRLVHATEVTDGFLRRSGVLLLSSMFPLAAGISIDFYLIARIILARRETALVLAALLFAVLCSAWFLLPRAHASRARAARTRRA